MENETITEDRKKLMEAVVKTGVSLGAAEAMSDEQLQRVLGVPKKPKPKALADMSLEDLEGMSDKALKKLCKEEDMVTDGKKEERFNRLYAKRFSLTKRYIGAETCCQFCGEKVRVKNTAKEQQADGRILVTRSMKCVGRHHHTYSLSQFEGRK